MGDFFWKSLSDKEADSQRKKVMGTMRDKGQLLFSTKVDSLSIGIEKGE